MPQAAPRQRKGAAWLWLAAAVLVALVAWQWSAAPASEAPASPKDSAAAPVDQAPQRAAAAEAPRRSVADQDRAAGDVVSGKVVDTDGNPFEGVEVTVVPTPPAPSSASRTAADGSFRFAPVPREPMRLVLTHPELVFANEPVPIAPRTNLRIVLHRRPIVRGRVIDARTNSPIAEFQAGLVAVDRDAPSAHWNVPPDAPLLRSDDGTFALRAEQGGTCMLLVTAAHCALTRTRLELKADSVTTTEVRLEPGVVVRGSLRDALGNPVADASVTLATGDQSSGATATTLEDGTFLLPPLADGTYNLATLHPELPTLQQFGIALQWTAAPPVLDLRLPPGANATGLVQNWTAGAQAVVVFQHEAGPTRQAAIDPATGAFSIQGLTPGRHSVGVVRSDAGWRSRVAAAFLDTVLAPSVDMAAGEPIELQLSDPVPAMSLLRGRVVGAPNTTIRIVALCEDLPLPDRVNGLFRAEADTQGRFALDGLVAAHWRVEIWTGDRLLAAESVEIAPQDTVERDFSVAR